MEPHITSECPAQATARRIERIERLRDAMPAANRVLVRMAGKLPPQFDDGLRLHDDDLILESERLRDELAAADPHSLEGAVAQIIAAERDWLSADPQLRLRAVSMVRRASRYMSARRLSQMGQGVLGRVELGRPDSIAE